MQLDGGSSSPVTLQEPPQAATPARCSFRPDRTSRLTLRWCRLVRARRGSPLLRGGAASPQVPADTTASPSASAGFQPYRAAARAPGEQEVFVSLSLSRSSRFRVWAAWFCFHACALPLPCQGVPVDAAAEPVTSAPAPAPAPCQHVGVQRRRQRGR